MGLSDLFTEMYRDSKKEPKISRKELYAVSAGVFGIGLINFILALGSDQFSGDDQIAWIAMSGVMTFGSLGFFIYLLKSGKKKKGDALNSLFYTVLKEKKGKITLIDFAMRANIEADAARTFLEKKAIEFSAQPEITEDGEVVYIFVKTQNY